jgi:hypothetical protein
VVAAEFEAADPEHDVFTALLSLASCRGRWERSTSVCFVLLQRLVDRVGRAGPAHFARLMSGLPLVDSWVTLALALLIASSLPALGAGTKVILKGGHVNEHVLGTVVRLHEL